MPSHATTTHLQTAWSIAGAAVLMAAGALLGWAGANQLQERQLSAQIEQSTLRVLGRLDEIIGEARQVFDALGRVELPHCSEEMLLVMRAELFEARFIKDIGGIRNHDLYCSTALGRLEQPFTSGPPDLSLIDDIGLRTDRSVLAAKTVRTLVIEHRWFNALVDPRLITDLTASQAGGEIFLRPIDSGNASWQALQSSGNERLEQLAGPKRQGLTMSACSDRSGLCALLHFPQHASQRALETQLVISTLGGALGLALFMAVAFTIRQRRTPIFALRRAIDRGLITAVYQPIFRLPGQTLYGFEVLARWRDGDGPVLNPESFISLAEQSNLIERITGQMIRQIGRDLGPWLAESRDHRVAINIAPAELLGSRLLAELDRHLLRQGIQPSQILLEITERTMVSSEEAAAAIESLSERGFRVFADDFGIGYCGLSYLNDLRMDGIKISQTFTAALATDSPKAALVPRIIEMAQQLKLEVIVEGVETQAQLDALQSAAPILLQGWLLGREQPASRLPETLAKLGST